MAVVSGFNPNSIHLSDLRSHQVSTSATSALGFLHVLIQGLSNIEDRFSGSRMKHWKKWLISPLINRHICFDVRGKSTWYKFVSSTDCCSIYGVSFSLITSWPWSASQSRRVIPTTTFHQGGMFDQHVFKTRLYCKLRQNLWESPYRQTE